jgi:hypothetical protein
VGGRQSSFSEGEVGNAENVAFCFFLADIESIGPTQTFGRQQALLISLVLDYARNERRKLMAGISDQTLNQRGHASHAKAISAPQEYHTFAYAIPLRVAVTTFARRVESMTIGGVLR